MTIAGATYRDGVAFIDGALCVTPVGVSSISGGNVSLVSRCAIPFVRPPTGTMGNNGAFTAGTAFSVAQAKCYMYFAADQIAAGVAAGWYYTEGSTTTAHIVYNNTWTSGIPTVPVSKTAFVTTGPGAVAGDTSEQGLLFSIAAGALGASGFWKAEAMFTNNNTAGAKVSRIRSSGIAGTQVVGQTNTTGTFNLLRGKSVNQGSAAVQAALGETIIVGAIAGAASRPNVNTALASTVAVTTAIAVATDWQIMEWATLELMADAT